MTMIPMLVQHNDYEDPMDVVVAMRSSLLLALPVELQSAVCDRLSPRDLRRLCAVASTCASVALPQLWRSPDLPAITSTKESAQVTTMLNSHGHHVRHLAFRDPSTIDLLHLNNLPFLQSLDLSGLAPFSVTDTHIIHMLHLAPQTITSFCLNDCVDMTDAALGVLLEYPGVARIVKLCLDRCCEVTDSGILPLMRRMLALKHLSLNLVPLITAAVISEVASHCPLLEHIGASDDDCMTDEGLAQLALGCPRLHSLDLSQCRLVTEDGLTSFASIRTGRSMITSINLSGVDAVASDSAIRKLLSGSPSLSTMTSSRCLSTMGRLTNLELSSVRINPAVLSHLAAAYPNNLRHLNLSHSVAIVGGTSPSPEEPALAALLASNLNLLSLRLPGCFGVNDNLCATVISQMSQLEILDLSDCTWITDAGVSPIATNCRNLNDVNLKGIITLGDDAVLPFVEIYPHTPLQSLNVGLCEKITDRCGISLARILCSKASDAEADMHTIKFSGCFNITSATLDAIAAATTRLRLLCLSGCYRITASSVTNLAAHLPFLQSLNLYACPAVTDTVIEDIARMCSCLAAIVISKCPVGDRGVCSIAKYLRGLHTAHFGFMCGDLGDIGVRSLLECCGGLKLLDLSRCELLTDACFLPISHADVSMGSPVKPLALQVLLLRCCPGVSARALETFVVQRCPRLQSLDVAGCRQIEAAERTRLYSVVDGI